jgi:transposase
MMNPFPGRNSIIILDNATVHHRGRLMDICNTAGVYLPPYLPDLNPIEKVFSVLKSQAKRYHLLNGTNDDPEIIQAHLDRMVTPRLMRNLFLGSCYSAR